MATTTDFKQWVNFVDLENIEEIYCIYRAVYDIQEWGAFKCSVNKTSNGDRYFLKCDYCDDTLMIASEKARQYFLDYIKKEYMQSEADIESWYSYKHSMEKDD